MILVSMESWDKGLLENIRFENTSRNLEREIFDQICENRDIFVVGQHSKFWIPDPWSERVL